MKSLSGFYSLDAVSKATEELREQGYSVEPMNSKTPLLDSWVCLAPDIQHYNFIFDAIPLNEWSSAYKITRCLNIPNTIWERINAWYAESD